MRKLYFRSNSPCTKYLILFFTGKKYADVLNRDVRETQLQHVSGYK